MAHSERDRQPNVDKEFRSLMEGLRTTLPGVQFIVAFLLTLPPMTGLTPSSRQSGLPMTWPSDAPF